MAYMQCLPESLRGSADWAIKCKGGEVLPCHFLILASASGELANLNETVKAVMAMDKKHEIPLNEIAEVAEAFLSWVYSHKVPVDPAMAYRLAALAQRLDAPGDIGFGLSSQLHSNFAMDCIWLLCKVVVCVVDDCIGR